MVEQLAILAAEHGGVFTTADAFRCSFSEYDIARLVRTGEWHRLRRGAYVRGQVWAASDEVSRHLLLTRAVLRAGSAEVASHTSGALALGVDMWRPNLSRVHTTYLEERHGRVEHGVNRHQGPLARAECTDANGISVAPSQAAVAGAMLLHPLTEAVVAGDSALNKQIVTHADLETVASQWWFHPRSRRLRYAVSLLDAGAESPGESLSRLMFVRHWLPRPQTQFHVEGPAGFSAWTDFAWPELGVLGEFDGKKKYMRDANDDDDPGDVVFREKRREDALRRLGWIVVRLVWAELFTPELTVARFRSALAEGQARAV